LDIFKERVNKYQEETKEFLNKWEDKSREFIHNFLDIFENRATKIKDSVQRAISPRPTTRAITAAAAAASSSGGSSSRKSSNSSNNSFSISKYLNRRNSVSKKRDSEDAVNLNGKRGLSHADSSSDAVKKGKFQHDALSSEESDSYFSSDDAPNVSKSAKQAPSSTNAKLKSKLKSIKKFSTMKFDELEDVDDETDNQIPLI
jgi:hypothetical protein